MNYFNIFFSKIVFLFLLIHLIYSGTTSSGPSNDQFDASPFNGIINNSIFIGFHNIHSEIGGAIYINDPTLKITFNKLGFTDCYTNNDCGAFYLKGYSIVINNLCGYKCEAINSNFQLFNIECDTMHDLNSFTFIAISHCGYKNRGHSAMSIGGGTRYRLTYINSSHNYYYASQLSFGACFRVNDISGFSVSYIDFIGSTGFDIINTHFTDRVQKSSGTFQYGNIINCTAEYIFKFRGTNYVNNINFGNLHYLNKSFEYNSASSYGHNLIISFCKFDVMPNDYDSSVDIESNSNIENPLNTLYILQENFDLCQAPSDYFVDSPIFSESLEFSKSKSFSSSTEFTPSSSFSVSSKFTSSVTFSKSKPFTSSDNFSPSSEFTSSDIFSPSSKFTSSKPFSPSSKFTSSDKFSPSSEFTLSRTFSPSSEFTLSDIFSPSSKFTLSRTFSPSISFSSSSKFTSSSTFSPSLTFTRSKAFSPSLTFTRSNIFSFSSIFTKSATFTSSSQFTLSSPFSPSPNLLFTHSFSPSSKFTSSEPFSPSTAFSSSNSFVPIEMETGKFTPSCQFTPSSTFTPSNQFTPSFTFTPNATKFPDGLGDYKHAYVSGKSVFDQPATSAAIGATAGISFVFIIVAVVLMLLYIRSKRRELKEHSINLSDDFLNDSTESSSFEYSYSYYTYEEYSVTINNTENSNESQNQADYSEYEYNEYSEFTGTFYSESMIVRPK